MKNRTLLACVFTIFVTTSVFASLDEAPKHIPGVFVGFTNTKSETEFSYGIEYEYKISKLWGAGLVYEKTDFADYGVDIALAAVYMHPWKELKIGLGYGKETVDSYTDNSDIDHPHYHSSHKEDVVRTSLSYDFHLGKLGIAPMLAIDFVDGETATVFGIAFVRAF